MPWWLILAICAAVFITLVFIRKLMRSAHPIRSVILGLLSGPCCMLAINIISVFTGVSMPVSPLSLGASAVLGIPGVTAMLLLQLVC